MVTHAMELAPCNETSRQMLVSTLDRIFIDAKQAEYIVKLFPNVLLDVARTLIEEATRYARQSTNDDPAEAVRRQLKPFFTFGFLLGKSPQITSLMYSYFEQSSFQPLPEKFFEISESPNGSSSVIYAHAGFDDDLVRDILKTYIKYLIFNPKLFNSVWNWSELGRIVASHPNLDLKYLAICNLSIITKPSRHQHLSMLRNMFEHNEVLIDLQVKYCSVYENVFTPLIESNPEKREQIMNAYGGRSQTGYSFDSQTLTNVVNILLLKHDTTSSNVLKNSHTTKDIAHKLDSINRNYVPVATLSDAISGTAYAVSINKPCLIRGLPGSGKTSMIDYVAAQTNRVCPPAYVKVQVGDQIDSRLLIGSYVCTEIPGQFEWQPGPLIQAMAYGSWIVFEDIDQAPSEMVQVIHSLIENGNTSCVSCCPIKLDTPHPDFRIFFTQRTHESTKAARRGFGFVDRLCDIIDVPRLALNDLKEIINKRYNFEQDLTVKILQLYEEAESSVREANLSRVLRPVTLRDLFKFCDRIFRRDVRQTSDGKYSHLDLELMLSDAIDCFIAFLPEANRVEAAKTLSQILNKPSEHITDILLRSKPDIRLDIDALTVGRVRLEITGNHSCGVRTTLANTRQSLLLLERLALCVKNSEPVLLVGETGVGKTTIVQHLASVMRTELVVLNLSQQSDSSDLLGGYRPVEMRDIISPIHERFNDLFQQTYDLDENKHFLQVAEERYITSKKCSEWLIYLKTVHAICGRALERVTNKDRHGKWQDLLNRVRRLSKRMSEENSSPMALSFAEGTLLRAVRKGKWLLLDEVNLAEPDVLQCLLLILDSLRNSHVYMQGADYENEGAIKIHPSFRVFACMNPSTDIGKRDLPAGCRARFSEFFVDDVAEKHEIRLIVESYVKTCLSPPQIESIVEFYQEVREKEIHLSDISGHSPVFSLRTLCRALTICAQNVCRDMEKSLYESFMVTFLQELNENSVSQVLKILESSIFRGTSISRIRDLPIQMPQDNHQYVHVEGFWIQTSSQKKIEDENYILTQSVSQNLKRICRIISLGQRRLPILIQGNTSVGKTSLIKYLANLTGNLCYRINNHEHTDLQDYVGRYVLRENGEMQFQEGLLVTAMKKGYWVILDELNLAPCELLEALNRVLDDNRELFIPETRDVVHAHAKFMLFATQNPPEEYAGRKLLSRAFRNRFIELNFDEIPHLELEEILHKRCKMPPQYAKKIVTVMRELQMFRRESSAFSGKNSFMTMRDLFRWGERYAKFKNTVPDDQTLDWEEFLAGEGLILLEGRARTLNESDTVKMIIEKVFRRKLDRDAIYIYNLPSCVSSDPTLRHIELTSEYRKIFVQLSQALKYKEPVLLCGQTGCGKTTACQVYAKIVNQELITYNCHLNTECSDFVGNVRPARMDDAPAGVQKFPWVDGPLVQAMRKGSIFLMDEISLADDAVLERVNSVLEPGRSITLTEKNGEELVAHERFLFVASMNPGGDYGKKEVSPALRNRFTEIYCHNPMDMKQVMSIAEKKLGPSLLKPKVAPSLINVVKRFLSDYYRGESIISLRDVITWIDFINKCTSTTQVLPLSIQQAIIDGANLVYFDQFGTCGHKASHIDASEEQRLRLLTKITRLVKSKFGEISVFSESISYNPTRDNEFVKIGHFCIPRGPMAPSDDVDFIFDAPIVKSNALKLIRALQLERPILLEGDPGIGKTSIVSAIAKKSGHKLIRINLSEQTDISDLFGSDLPDASNQDDDTPKFCWHDGPLLQAIKDSSWVLLDEMNLASQSVLEGLNACFDHRGEIFIPELNRKFSVDRKSTRIFACQNPHDQGAARKGLPRSFLNRFTSIYFESHASDDLVVILHKLYPNLPRDTVNKMIKFNDGLNSNHWMKGYEFNLRDLIYWCDLTTAYVTGDSFKNEDLYDPDRFVQFVYIDRLRSMEERSQVSELFELIFGYPVYEPPYRELKLGETSLIFSRSILARKNRPPPHLSDLCILKYQMPYLESISKALESNKMPILVGDFGTGKRSMVRILAGLTGNHLSVIGANRDMDVVELLGSFEQKSLQREIVDLIQDASDFVTSLINLTSHWSQDDSWVQLFKHIWSTLYATSIRDLKLSKTEMMDAYRFQLDQMSKLISELKSLCVDSVENRRQALKSRIKNLSKKLLFNSESTYSTGSFEWIDSVLVKSIREGRWLMIENANLLNPATLDRLNSLVEPNGFLSLNEKGSGKDGVEILKPHPDFRLILTMNPDFGELSRAMRNRGIEIYVRTRFYYEDFLMLLKQNGFKPTENTACLSYCIMQTCYDTHSKITGEAAVEDGGLLAYFGLNYLSVMAQQIRRGVFVDEILANLLTNYYHLKGFLDIDTDETVHSFVYSKMSEYKKKYVVDLNDDRYKWSYFMHDLVAMSGGDATLAMLVRENRLFWDTTDPISSGILKVDEVVDCLDIVNTCTTVKIFLEMSTQGDFEYRKGFIKDTFLNFPKLTDIVSKHVDLLHQECMPLINNQMPHSELIPVSEMYVDTRNSPDMQYYLQAIDYKGTIEREDMQNRWLLSIHRSTLEMIIKLIEDRTLDSPGCNNLWSLADKVRSGEMLKEDLLRPQAEIAVDLYDFLIGILRVVGDRCFENALVPKMSSRFFWIGYFLCKLKRGYNKIELVAICNQIPMLWALTYQKVIVPVIKDCQLADLKYNNRKFSERIRQISRFFDVNITKPSHIEKKYYNKVINLQAAKAKRCETIEREVDKFFSKLLTRYTLRSQILTPGTELMDVLTASGTIWSNSKYLIAMYRIQEMMLSIDMEEEDFETVDRGRSMLNEARKLLHEQQEDHHTQEAWIKKDDNRTRLLGFHRRQSSFDQFGPVWQVKFLQIRLSLLDVQHLQAVITYRDPLKRMLHCVNGVMMSPRYYGTLMKFFKGIEECLMMKNTIVIAASFNGDVSMNNDTKKINRRYIDMYAAFLVDHIMENIVLDHQVVGWTKMRVTTSDLSSSAPLIPEYAPIISLVGSYCLDIAHLKLNSYQNPNPQLDSMLIYLWRAYALIKNDPLEDSQDVALAKKFIHARCLESEDRQEIIGDHVCPEPNVACKCVEAYVNRRGPKFAEMIDIIKDQADTDDVNVIEKALKLVYFGFYSLLEFAPIFTLDPALRSREKLEVYNSEYAHVKLDLHQRNTLYYWRTGENLRLMEISPEEAKLYPFSIRVLVERRCKLEKSIQKLRKEYTNRPKSDDGTLYYELRKEVEITINRYTKIVESFVTELFSYLGTKRPNLRTRRLTHLNTKCRMLIKSVETTITRFKSDYALYSDLTTYYIVGLCFLLQGMRRLYSRLEPKMQIHELGFPHSSVIRFSRDIMRTFSFNSITMNNLESVSNKRALYPILGRICPSEKISHIQSLLLRSILIQLNHHIILTPSDIKQCIPIVQNVSDKFHRAWLERKNYLEEQRRKQEDLYQYKTPTVRMGGELDRKTFIEVSKKFPIYDHIYLDDQPTSTERLSADEENLATEAKIINLNRSVDLTMCIDVCKAHYGFMKEASSNLLGLQDMDDRNSSNSSLNSHCIRMDELIKLEAEILYTMMRKCAPNFDKTFDALSLECHLLQANELIKLLKRERSEQIHLGSLNSSIEILNECVFDIYHDADVREALRLQEFMSKIDSRINEVRKIRSFESHPSLNAITRLTTKISSFLMTDPLMKFVTGAHMLLQCLEQWNQVARDVAREHRFMSECDELIDLIKSWRKIEVQSWRSCLHRVKKKFIDDSLCDLWFRLYEAFRDPVVVTKKKFIECDMMDEEDELNLDEYFYQGFVMIIKDFIEGATLGDYQIRLDLVFSFTVQSRFATLFDQSRKEQNAAKNCSGDNHDNKVDLEDKSHSGIDYEKLTTYVYNMYRQYQGLMRPLKGLLEKEEEKLKAELNEQIRIVNWQGRNAWEIKNNFRISHKRLNDVMNSYLKILSEPVAYDHSLNQSFELQAELGGRSCSSVLFDRYSNTGRSFSSLSIASDTLFLQNLNSLNSTSKTARRMIELSNRVCELAGDRYVKILEALEDSLERNSSYIKSFQAQKVGSLIIQPNDSKDTRDEKIKTCRQMHHSKRYALQAIFKDLQQLGVSHQRGLNNLDNADKLILPLEPLKGMIQDQCNYIMKATSDLIDDSLLSSCNQLYQQMISRSLIFLSIERPSEQLTSDHIGRMKGYVADIQLDVCRHKRNAAIIYRYMIDIQASSTRLTQLQERYQASQKILIYNFARVRRAIRCFDELVGKTLSSFARLDSLLDCYQTYSQLWESNDKVENTVFEAERIALKELIVEIDDKHALMTKAQFEHIKKNLDPIRERVANISSELRDKLKLSVGNYLFDDHDIQSLKGLCSNFIEVFESLISTVPGDELNIQKGTILGSLRTLLSEIKLKLPPMWNDISGSRDNFKEIDFSLNVKKLNIRLQKLVKQVKMATQGVYMDETEFSSKEVTSELDKRKIRPFNHIDSGKMRGLLRPNSIAKRVANCFMTLNMEQGCNIEPIVRALAPMMVVYTQNLACCLNTILLSVRLKLISANQLATFFKDVQDEGFGVPYSEKDIENMTKGTSSSEKEPNEDNTGFGEGEGQTDASKKLEFESQLDELKSSDDGNQNKDGGDDAQQDEEDRTEQNDDGVEMTDDFGAKAQGPEPDPGDEDDNEYPVDQDVLDDLDAELDKVDDDEGNLDQKLWDDDHNDDSDAVGEDDEQDLRETDVDKSAKNDTDTIDLMAKDENLPTTNEESGENENRVHADNNQAEHDDNSVESISDINEDDFIDLDTEMGIENVDMEDDLETNGRDENDKSDQIEEITLDSNEDQENLDGEPVDLSDMDTGDDEISEEIPTQNDAIEREESRIGDSGGVDSSNTDHLDQGLNVDSKQEQQSALDSDRGEDDSKPEQQADSINQGSREQQVSAEGIDNEKNIPPIESNDGASTKRTLAQRNSADDASAIKRQKIESAKPDNGQIEDTSKEIEEVRHLEEDKKSAFDVIDLADDTDDELLLDAAAELERLGNEVTGSTREPKCATDSAEPSDRSSDGDNDQKENLNSSYNTNLGLLKYIMHSNNNQDENTKQSDDAELIMRQIDNELSTSKASSTEHESIEMDKLTKLWYECTRNTNHLVHELSQQLQIVLQPTKMSKYRGDYKTGKRLNMRKIISYIASHYRKDKIWLRRTKPAKRTYNISLAVDNSSSMSENNCRSMTYQSLALLARSLSLIEAGSLSVVKFGEQVQCIHEFDQPYMDAVGAQWLRELRFDEKRTSYSKMLKFSSEAFAKQAQQSLAQIVPHSTSLHQLLIIISDGRNVTSEDEGVKSYLRQLKSLGVLTLFVIIDDLKLNNGKSIVDVKSCIRVTGPGSTKTGSGIQIENYLDVFPFPFYVLLRQIEAMPSILGDALRQWFEMISNIR